MVSTHPSREERQELLLRLAQAALRRETGLRLDEWLADAELAFRAAKERLAGDLWDAWREESRRLDLEHGGCEGGE